MEFTQNFPRVVLSKGDLNLVARCPREQEAYLHYLHKNFGYFPEAVIDSKADTTEGRS